MGDVTIEGNEGWQWSRLHLALNGIGGKARCEPNWSWQPLPLADYDLWYAVKGRGEMYINGFRHEIRSGTFFVLRPGDVIHASHRQDDPLTVLFCHFAMTNLLEIETGGWHDPLPEQRCVYIRDTYRLEPLLHQLVDMTYWEEADAANEAEYDLLLKLILTRWLKEMDRQHEPARNYYVDQIIQTVHNEIRFRLSEEIHYETVVAASGLSARYVSALMKRHTGLTLKETISKLRMERAAHLLGETAMTVSEVAEALAYSDIYTFSKLFKRYYGHSPSEARRQRQ
ncbi:helix-turn-helix domain-containing protein [Paenibacillus sp. strain BS8-2]